MIENTNPRRFVFMFQSQFAELVTTGLKRQTIRAPRDRRPTVGDLIDCRAWTGAPYRSKQRHLCRGRITKVADCLIFRNGVALESALVEDYGFELLDSIRLHGFAQADGFKDIASMNAWFSETHGLPFGGMLVRWEVVE